MAYLTRTKDDPGEVGRSSDQQQSIDNEEYLKEILENDNVIRRIVVKEAIADNVVTEILTITTTDEAGNNDAGGWSVKLHGLVGHETSNEAGTDTAVKGFGAQFCRAMENTGVGVSSVVLENLETASAATTAAQRDIGAVTMTLVETSEYITSVRIQIDLLGAAVTTAEIVFIVELAYYGFLTPPVIAES